MKDYTVFNVEQIESLPEQYRAAAEPRLDPVMRIAAADSLFDATGASIADSGNRASYTPAHDRIQMPHFEAFKDAESYYATLAHETTHWTSHSSRLDREFGRKRGRRRLRDGGVRRRAWRGLPVLRSLANPAGAEGPRVLHWIKVLKNDKRAIFSAASHAQRAADFIQGKQPTVQHKRFSNPKNHTNQDNKDHPSIS